MVNKIDEKKTSKQNVSEEKYKKRYEVAKTIIDELNIKIEEYKTHEGDLLAQSELHFNSVQVSTNQFKRIQSHYDNCLKEMVTLRHDYYTTKLQLIDSKTLSKKRSLVIIVLSLSLGMYALADLYTHLWP